MSWQERLRQMVLAGGVLVAGCGGEHLGATGTGGSPGTGGDPGSAGSIATGGSPGTGGDPGSAGSIGTGGSPGTGGSGIPNPIQCGNANPDPCICGRPEASSAAADACSKITACEAVGGDWVYDGNGQYAGQCERDGGIVSLDGAAAGTDGGVRD